MPQFLKGKPPAWQRRGCFVVWTLAGRRVAEAVTIQLLPDPLRVWPHRGVFASANRLSLLPALTERRLKMGDDAMKLLPALKERANASVKVPTRETAKAMKELDAGKGQQFETPDVLFSDLGI